MATPDEQVLTRAQQGDRAALNQLLEQQEDAVYRFTRRMCRNPADAADVFQETMLSLARGVENFRAESSLSTWIYMVARSHCIKQRRRGKETLASANDASAALAELPDSRANPEDTAARRETEHMLENMLNGLEPEQREVLILRDMEGLTAPEVAEVLGISIAAVKSRLHRARIAAREALLPLLHQENVVREASCPDVLLMFSQHLEDEISASVCADMQRHLDACDRCRATCDSLQRTLNLCRTTGQGEKVPKALQDSVRASLRLWLAQ